MAKSKEAYPTTKQYTLGEELVNSISHGAGVLLGIVGTIALLIRATLLYDTWAIVSASVYGFSLIVLYTMSTLYHAITNDTAKRIFRTLDHSSIFLLIAGTYTPYALVTLNNWVGWAVFGFVWACAVLGIILNSLSVERFKKISMGLYIASGWAVVLSGKGIIDALPLIGVILLGLGGFFYTVGIVFYVIKSKKYFHGIWHLFVIAGSISHYFSIFLYVMKA